MNSRRPAPVRPERRRLVHAAMDAYLGWRDACGAVQETYLRWTAADESDSARAYRHYAAALDAEDRACALYAELIERARAARQSELVSPASRLAVASHQGQR